MDPEAYGYRPKRSALDAVRRVHQLLCEGFTDVVDGDLSKPPLIRFRTMPSCCSAWRGAFQDRQVLNVIKRWLKTLVDRCSGFKTGTRRMTGEQAKPLRPPQGGGHQLRCWPISVHDPPFSEVLAADEWGREASFGPWLVNYADDFRFCSRGCAAEALQFTARTMVAELRADPVHQEKTKLVEGQPGAV